MGKVYDSYMHTAEHILNQTMIRMFDCGRDFRAHIEKKKSKCDYHFNRNITDEDIKNIEHNVNKVIKENLSVEEFFIPRSKADELYNTSKLPESAREDIRIVKIGNYDECPCIGPHVKSTKEIGEFKIISADLNAGILRIRFKLLSTTN